MGAGIVKPQPDGTGGFKIHINTGTSQNIHTAGGTNFFTSTSSSTSTSTPTTQGRSASPSMGCEDCGASFTPFKRKKPCKDCGRNFCSQCVIQPNRRPSSANSKDYQCKTCQILLAGKFTRTQLLTWKIKDLKALLNRQNVNISKCKEKGDLIDVIFTSYGGTQNLYRRGTEQEMLVQQMAERMREVHESSSPRQSTTTTTTGSFQPPPPPAQYDLYPENSAESNQQPGTSDDSQQQQQGNSEQQSDQEMADQEEEETESKDAPPPNLHIQLEDIKSEAEIDSLDIKSLKRLLLNNFVDYKGCREKWELQDRLKRLWKENEANKKKYEEQINPPNNSSSVPPSQNAEDELCKICMDATIDCVLLECGHMISCTKCGKQLSECPICRQYVVRAVHTFRS